MNKPKFSVFFAHVCDLAKEKQICLDEAAAFVKALGFEGVDCDYGYIKNHYDELISVLNKYSFAVPAVPAFFFFEKGVNEALIDDVLLTVNKVNCKTILAIPGEYSENDDEETRKTKLSLMVSGLKLLTEKAERYGIKITLEDFDSIYSPCATDDGLAYFFKEVPALGFNMDTGNFMYMDLDTEKCCERFIGKINHVHLKDRALTKKYADFPEKVTPENIKLYPSPVGHGVIPMKKLTDLAKSAGYEGYYTAENSCPIHMEEFLTESIKWMKENI